MGWVRAGREPLLIADVDKSGPATHATWVKRGEPRSRSGSLALNQGDLSGAGLSIANAERSQLRLLYCDAVPVGGAPAS
jgi:hypothetical protein